MQDEKEKRARALEEMRKQLEEHESNCEYLRGNIQELEFLCRKKKQMLSGDDKQDVEHVRDQRALPAATNPGRSVDKRYLNPAGSVLGKPRFMTATASSRLKGRPEGCHADTLNAGKGEKPTKPQKRHSLGCVKRRGAKVSPLDSNVPFEQGSIPDNKLTHTTYTGGSEAKLIQKLAGLSICPSSKAIYAGDKNPFSISRHLEQINHKSSDLHEQVKNTIRSSTIMRRRLTVECSGQITVNTRF